MLTIFVARALLLTAALLAPLVVGGGESDEDVGRNDRSASTPRTPAATQGGANQAAPEAARRAALYVIRNQNGRLYDRLHPPISAF